MKHEHEKNRIHDQWGVIAKRIAGNDDAFNAVSAVLMYEYDILSTQELENNRLALGADQAHAQASYAKGFLAGMDHASRCLLDADFISERQQKLTEHEETEGTDV